MKKLKEYKEDLFNGIYVPHEIVMLIIADLKSEDDNSDLEIEVKNNELDF